jgi:hypothetical protein
MCSTDSVLWVWRGRNLILKWAKIINKETLVRDTGLQVNAQLTSCEQNAGQDHSIQTGIKLSKMQQSSMFWNKPNKSKLRS